MKIAFLSFYQDLPYRGVERWLDELVFRLGEKMEMKIFFPPKPVLPQQDYTGSWKRKLFLDPNSRAILGHCLKTLPRLKKYDLIVPLNGGWQALLTRIYTLIFKKKMVIIGHSGLGYDDRWNLLCRPDLFISLSHYQRQWAGKYFSGKVVVVSNGIDLQEFKPQGKKLNFDLRPPVVLCVSWLDKMKFFKSLVLAVKKINGSLLFAGGGDRKQKEKVDAFAKKELGPRYLRQCFNYAKMPLLYRSVDLFVYPNPPWESFGIVFLEAMACNLPVIATDDPIRREVLGRAGLFVDPESSSSIARAIEKAVELDWGKKPRKQAEKFSWERVAKKYEEIFRFLINKNES